MISAYQFGIRGLVACKLVARKKIGVYREKKAMYVHILKLFSNNKVKLLQLRKNKPRKKFSKKQIKLNCYSFTSSYKLHFS